MFSQSKIFPQKGMLKGQNKQIGWKMTRGWGVRINMTQKGGEKEMISHR